jgi:hypothetical protein
MIRSSDLRHLTKRWWLSLTSRGPDAKQNAWAESFLTEPERELWLQMGVQDRSHAVLVAERFMAARPGATRPEMVAALLHDVGKVNSQLGTWSRVGATIVPLRVLPQRAGLGGLRRRWESYHNHEQIGIQMLESIGADCATIDLLKGRGPAVIDLEQADQI